MRSWDPEKLMNCDQEVEVTAKNMRNFLNFRPEFSYKIRWLTMDAIVAYARRIFETHTFKIITTYPFQHYVRTGNLARGGTIKAKVLFQHILTGTTC